MYDRFKKRCGVGTHEQVHFLRGNVPDRISLRFQDRQIVQKFFLTDLGQIVEKGLVFRPL